VRQFRGFSVLGLFFLSFLTPPEIFAMDTFPSRIPNGNVFSCFTCHTFNIPNRNAFGADFKDNGKVWSAALANLDSDGDGHTNGVELLDPTGSWTQGSPNPGNSSEVTNPGVADNFPDPTATDTPVPQPTNTPTHTRRDEYTFVESYPDAYRYAGFPNCDGDSNRHDRSDRDSGAD